MSCSHFNTHQCYTIKYNNSRKLTNEGTNISNTHTSGDPPRYHYKSVQFTLFLPIIVPSILNTGEVNVLSIGEVIWPGGLRHTLPFPGCIAQWTHRHTATSVDWYASAAQLELAYRNTATRSESMCLQSIIPTSTGTGTVMYRTLDIQTRE